MSKLLKDNEKATAIKENDRISFTTEIVSAYLDYSRAVITDRALPVIEDGLKKVQRRILYSMYEGNYLDRFVKSARVIGDTNGKFHPHGENATYEAMVRMTYKFIYSIPLLEGQGNMGGIDGLSPAASRYTEIRAARIAHYLLDDLKYKVVDYHPNYDSSTFEPSYLPAAFPNAIVNGAMSISVVFVCFIPPHNLGEVIDATIYALKCSSPEAVKLSDIRKYILGPDFTTNCIIDATNLDQIYETGTGTLRMSSKIEIDTDGNILIIGLPYSVRKRKLIESIIEAHEQEKISNIDDIIDLSTGDEYCIKIKLLEKRTAGFTIKQLRRSTMVEHTIGCNFLLTQNEKPKIYSLVEMINYHIEFRISIMRKRLHAIIESNMLLLEKIIANIIIVQTNNTEKFIRILRETSVFDQAKKVIQEISFDLRGYPKLIALLPEHLKENIEKFTLTPIQIEYVFKSPISNIAVEKQTTMEAQARSYKEKIDEAYRKLRNPKLIKEDIIEELTRIKKEFGRPRLSEIREIDNVAQIDTIEDRAVLFTVDRTHNLKTIELVVGKDQQRGGKGRSSSVSNTIISAAVVNYKDIIYLFTKDGIVYRNHAFKFIEEKFKPKSVVVSILPFNIEAKCLLMITMYGKIKKINIDEINNMKRNEKSFIKVYNDDDDYLVRALFCQDNDRIGIFTHQGRYIVTSINEFRDQSISAKGVAGIKLKSDDKVIDALLLSSNIDESDNQALVVTDNGFAKLLTQEQQERSSRRNTIGSKIIASNSTIAGCINIKKSIIVLTRAGKMLQVNAKQFPSFSSATTKGVKLINIDEDDCIVCIVSV